MNAYVNLTEQQSNVLERLVTAYECHQVDSWMLIADHSGADLVPLDGNAEGAVKDVPTSITFWRKLERKGLIVIDQSGQSPCITLEDRALDDFAYVTDWETRGRTSVQFILPTTFDYFERWLEHRTLHAPNERFNTQKGHVCLQRARRSGTGTGPVSLTMEGFYVVESKGSEMAWPSGSIISFRVLPLNEKRIQVTAECNQRVVRAYFEALLNDIESAWPSVAAPPQNQNIIGGDYVVGQKTGDISVSGGIVNIGNFNDVVNNLNAAGQEDLAASLAALAEAVNTSQQLDAKAKEEVLEDATSLGEEAAKPRPNRRVLQALYDNMLKLLDRAPELILLAQTLGPYIGAI